MKKYLKILCVLLITVCAMSAVYTHTGNEKGGIKAADYAGEEIKSMSAQNVTSSSSMLVKEWENDEPSLYARPTAPNGKTHSTVAAIDFSGNTIRYAYAERTENSSAFEYGFTPKANGDIATYFCTTGGNSLPGLSIRVVLKEITGASGLMIFVDFRNIQTPTSPEFGIRLLTTADGKSDIFDDFKKYPIADGTECLYYDYDGEWKSTTAKDGRAKLPDSFMGYLYVPASGYPDICKNGRFDTAYLHHINVMCKIADENECATTILVDDLVFINETETVHNHEYQEVKTVEPTCKTCGYVLEKCTTCNQTKMTNKTQPSEHVTSETFALGSGSGAICTKCNALIRSDKPSSNIVPTVQATFSYGNPVNKEITLTFPKEYTLKQKDIPWEYRGEKKNAWGITDKYQFFAYNSSLDYDELINPVGLTLTEDITLYGTYNIYSYDNEHFGHMFKQIATHGGPYNAKNLQGKTVFIGNSNYMLWWGMESWYHQRGVQVLNNSIAGSTCYDLLQYVEELILIYHPKVVVMGVSSNDFCYHQMKDADVINNGLKFMDIVREHCPGVKFVVGGMNPLPGRPEYFSSIKRINAKFDKIVSEMPDATFIDTAPQVWEFCKEYPEGWNFWTHMNEDRLSVFLGDMMLPTIKSYLAA